MYLAVLCVMAFFELKRSDEAPMREGCLPSETMVHGTHAPNNVCSGELIFNDDFEEFDLEVWQHENTLNGGKYGEFQWFNNNRTNSFTQSGFLSIRPSLTMDQYGEPFLTSGTLDVEGGAPADRCTNPKKEGCVRTGTAMNILNPVKSASIRTVNSFSFRYGLVEVRAKMPAGDWLWPAISMMPAHNAYGSWPSSGEINLVECRGNRDLLQYGVNIGTQEATSTLLYGPHSELKKQAKWVQRNSAGYNSEFHNYQLEWTSEYIKFSIDDTEMGGAQPSDGGFWSHGGFGFSPNDTNPWRHGSKMAPFDQKFYIVITLAVGGTNGFFPEKGVVHPYIKPWYNSVHTTALLDFWIMHRTTWLPTWKLDEKDGQEASLQVDYVRVWAL